MSISKGVHPVATDAGNESKTKELSYEEAFAQLDQVLVQLERDDLPLEESLVLYEKGVALSTHCSMLLDGAELRVQQWQADDHVTDFNGWQEG